MNNNTQHELIPLLWGDIDLKEVVYLNGIPYPTKRSMGEWLEYADPMDSIKKILTRNNYIEAWGTDIKLISVDGKLRDTRVYHPIGFHLVVMESGQPRAQQFKTAVAKFVYHFTFGNGLSFDQEMKLKSMLYKALEMSWKAPDQFSKELIMSDMVNTCVKLGQHIPNPNKIGKAINTAQLYLPNLTEQTTH